MTNALRPDETLPAYSIHVSTPDGEMWVTIIERKEQPVQVFISIGKAGSNVMAWAEATGRIITRMLEHLSIYEVITELSGITSGRLVYGMRGAVCRSGPEGIAIALMEYRKEKFNESRFRGGEGKASVDRQG